MRNEVVYLSAFAGKMKDAFISYCLHFPCITSTLTGDWHWPLTSYPAELAYGTVSSTPAELPYGTWFLEHLIKVPQLNY